MDPNEFYYKYRDIENAEKSVDNHVVLSTNVLILVHTRNDES